MKKQQLMFTSLFIATILAGCGSKSTQAPQQSSDQKVTITMWQTFSDVETKVFDQKVIPAFEKDNPNIKVKATRMPSGDEYNQQIIQAISGNSAPDLARVEVTAVPKYAKLGAFYQIDKQKDFEQFSKQLVKGPLNTNLYEGHYYGIPLDTNTRVAIYNKALLAKAGLKTPPTDFKTLIDKAKGIVDDETFIFGPAGSSAWGLMPYFYSLGGTFANKKSTKATGYLDSKASIQAMKTLVEWNKKGYMGKSLTGGLGTWEGLNGGNYLMIDEGPWYAQANKKTASQVTYALFPKGKAGSLEVIGGENTVIFNSSKHKESAYKFAKYLASDKAQTIFAKELEMLPVNRTTTKKPVVQDNELMALYSKQLDTAVSRIPSAKWEQIDKTISLAFENCLVKGGDPAATLKDAAMKVDTYLAE